VDEALKRVAEQAAAVEGWLARAEGKLLCRLAQRCTGRGVIVEIGSWKGKSTVWLGSGSRMGSQTKVHAIDPHTGSPEHHDLFGQVWTFHEFQRNIRQVGLDDIVVPRVEASVPAASNFAEPVELIFIDGLHEYEGVKADFDAWVPKVIDGGIVAFHDTTGWDGPKRVVIDHLFKSRNFRKVGFVCSITYGEKVAQNTRLDRLRNRVALCFFLIHARIDTFLYRLIHTCFRPEQIESLKAYYNRAIRKTLLR